jgi:uncharacterized DUF497 family protein
MKSFPESKSFEWDEGNINKNWDKHRVHHLECEEVFFNEPITTKVEKKGASQEERISALGVTNEGRFLFVVFIIRRGRIRVISARDMNKKERKIYHEKIKKGTKI